MAKKHAVLQPGKTGSLCMAGILGSSFGLTHYVYFSTMHNCPTAAQPYLTPPGFPIILSLDELDTILILQDIFPLILQLLNSILLNKLQ